MGKGKPRHNPDKLQNKMGGKCPYYETYSWGAPPYCESGNCDDAKKCKGNPHNCVKTFYVRLASRSDVQKQNGDYKRK